jgi:hypothetical protein
LKRTVDYSSSEGDGKMALLCTGTVTQIQPHWGSQGVSRRPRRIDPHIEIMVKTPKPIYIAYKYYKYL